MTGTGGHRRTASGPDTDALHRLARLHGLLPVYRDHRNRPVQVDTDTLRALLGTLGVDASRPRAVRDGLAAERTRRAARPLPPTVTASRAGGRLPARSGQLREVWVELEDGRRRRLRRPGRLPAGLPVGRHQLLGVDRRDARHQATLLVPPDRLTLPGRSGAGRGWGWAVQLYATRSDRSWGIGDFADLAALARWAGRQGADLLLCSPVGAPAPVAPVEPSPYYPSSRRFANPLHLRVEDLPEYRRTAPSTRRRVDALRLPADGELVDRDAVWAAKDAALSLLWQAAGRPDHQPAAGRSGRQPAADRSDRRRPTRTTSAEPDGALPGLAEFALWCALAEVHGRDWRRWPAGLRRPSGPAVPAWADRLAGRVAYHAWVQRRCAGQLAAAQRAAQTAGMRVGVLHDLPVGVDPGGADAWSWQHLFAGGTTVGAPPDDFTAAGQDWQLPAFHPDRLAAAGYRPLSDTARALLGHGGGLRVDHVAGLFRLWWIPPGHDPAHGGYVRYDHRAMLAALLVEAHRAGAVLVGEDLGTVPPQVTRETTARGLLGSAVLWFERERNRFRPWARWPAAALATVTTHDLPTARGFLHAEHVRVRADRGLLGRRTDEEWQRAATEKAQLLRRLRADGLLPPTGEPTDDEFVAAMHAALTRTPCRLVAAWLADAAGDLRQPNLPGTTDSYPNWRLPLATPTAGGTPRPVLLEELRRSPQVRRLAAVLHDGLGRQGRLR